MKMNRNVLYPKANHRQPISIHSNPFQSISHNHGLTLVELLITTTIVGVIMVGMVSVDFALRTNEQQQTRGSLASLRTSATLTDIMNTAQQAYGDAATRCIQMPTAVGAMQADNTNYICIYRDTNLTFSNYNDDSWTCYTRRGTNFHKCTIAPPTVYPLVFGGCVATDPIIGTVTTDVFNPPDTPNVVRTSPNFFFEMTLINRFDPTVAGQGTSVPFPQEYLTNPLVRQTSRVAPGGCVP